MRLRKKPWIEKALPEVIAAGMLINDGMECCRGHWQERFPGKELCLEIGCGKGGFITGMAQIHPEKAFIGIETQSDIAYYPAKKAMETGLGNVVIISGNAAFMEDWFAPGEVRTQLFDFSVEEFRAFGMEIRGLSYDLHNSSYPNEVQTEYEKKFSALGTPINYCEAVFTADCGKVETRSPKNIRPAVSAERE